jgi:uracil-DNA glycosylase
VGQDSAFGCSLAEISCQTVFLIIARGKEAKSMAIEFSKYVLDEDDYRRDLMDRMSMCRDEEKEETEKCPVPRFHPLYPVRHKPEWRLNGEVGCMPVVPTWLRRNRVMILGMYPTCRFANVIKDPLPEDPSEEKDKEEEDKYETEVPVGDINEPFENSRYFDRYNIRDVRSGTVLYDEYLEPLGLEQKDLWITNMVKCFLFKPGHVDAYKNVGWTPPKKFKPTRDPDNPDSETEMYFKAAERCIDNWLREELEECQPKLIVALGKKVCRMIHADQELKPAEGGVWAEVRGKRLRANYEDSGLYKRHGSFKDKNVICLHHPARLKRSQSARESHEDDLRTARKFMEELDLYY